MICKMAKSELTDIRTLWELCFPDETGFNDYFFKNIFNPVNVLIFKEDDIICAMLQRIPYKLNINGEIEDISYIYGACTAPEYRKKGYMAQLLEKAFEEDIKEGKIASVLIPAEKWLFDFYKKFGYESFFYINNKKISKDKKKVELPQRLSLKDISTLSNCYKNYLKDCYIERGEKDWQDQIQLFDSLGKGVYGWFEKDKLCAYAFCWEDMIGEAFGMNEEREQGILKILELSELSYTCPGDETALGMIKWHALSAQKKGYFNLMFN